MMAPTKVGLVLALVTMTTACLGRDTGDRGEVLYANNCVPCHGEFGEGKQGVGAPAIAGLPQWYVERQVRNFQDGVRGAHFEDVAGLRMRPMSRTLSTDEDLVAVSAQVAKMPRVKGAITLEGGDAEKGKATYAGCAACHGGDAMGIEPSDKTLATSGPPLKGADDWYLLTQLKNFKGGIRGTDAEADVGGASMAATGSAFVADEQAMLDVIAYIKTLD